MRLDKIDSICARDCQLERERPVVVGVSGGADSLALLDALHQLGYRLVAAHFDHQFRADSGADVAYVRGVAERYGIEFVSAAADVPAMASAARLSLEEAGRAARYQFLFEQARACGAQAVAVGHTADDQVETVLMHLLRGSGLAGLKGMQPRGLLPAFDAHIPVVRPLLDVWRAETETWCAAQGLTPLQDASNSDTSFFRNRVRHELIPLLETYNPRVKARLARTAQALAGDFEVLEGAVAAAWRDCLVSESDTRVALRRANFAAQPVGLQRGLVRRAVARLRPGLRDLDFDTVVRALVFAETPSATRQTDLAQGLRLAVEGAALVLSVWGAPEALSQAWPRMAAGTALELPVPGAVELADGWRIRAKILAQAPEALDDPASTWLDADALRFPLVVRTRRAGDRFQPLGMDGHALKLSDFWVNARLERAARATWPLVFSGETLAWIPMFRPAHPFRVQGGTRRVARLTLERG